MSGSAEVAHATGGFAQTLARASSPWLAVLRERRPKADISKSAARKPRPSYTFKLPMIKGDCEKILFPGRSIMLTRGQQLVAQQIVSWHPGSGGGQAWVKWGVDAIAQFKATDGRLADHIYDDLRKLWGCSDFKETKLLAASSQAGEELLRCSTYFILQQQHDPVALSPNVSSAQLLPQIGHARMWAREMAILIEAIGELPPDAIELVREASGDRGVQFPHPIDTSRRCDLVDAAEAILHSEHGINTGTWPKVLGSTLDDAEARASAEFLLRLANHPGSRSGADIAFRGMAYDFNQRALDGFELELFAIHILHVPAADSALRNQVRDRMIQVIEEAIAGPTSFKKLYENASSAAMVLTGIGDEHCISKITQWLCDRASSAARLFRPERFLENGYELDIRGRRRDVLLDFKIEFAEGPRPAGPQRSQAIEIFRPIGGKCSKCGGRMLALFDIMIDPKVHRGFPEARRILLPVCMECCHSNDGYTSSLRCDVRAGSDLDAWSCDEASSVKNFAPARQFQERGEADKERAEAWLGGAPAWQQYVQWPICEQCRRHMLFAGQVGSVGPSYYGFFCPDCLTSNVRVQYD